MITLVGHSVSMARTENQRQCEQGDEIKQNLNHFC